MRNLNKNILSLLLSLFLFNSALTQVNNSFCCDSAIVRMNESKLIGELFQITRVGEGSQFFLNEWLPGDIYLTNNSVVQNKRLKYNGFLDELIWLDNVQLKQVKLDKDAILGFKMKNIITNEIYNFLKITIKKDFITDSTLIFGQILYQNKLSLFAYRRIVYGPPVQVSENGRAFIKEVYEPSHLYYFKLLNGKTIGFKKLRKRNLFAMFPDKAQAIKIALKENKLRVFKNEMELIKVTEILNPIIYNIH